MGSNFKDKIVTPAGVVVSSISSPVSMTSSTFERIMSITYLFGVALKVDPAKAEYLAVVLNPAYTYSYYIGKRTCL